MIYHVTNHVEIEKPTAEVKHWVKRTFTVLGNGKEEPCYRESADSISIPRGAARAVHTFLTENGLDPKPVDQRPSLPSIGFYEDVDEIGPDEIAIVEEVLKGDFNILMEPIQTRRIAIALGVIIRREQRTLILVNDIGLVDLWRSQISSLFKMPLDDVGLITHSCKRIGDATVALATELGRDISCLNDVIGHVIVENCFDMPRSVFESTISRFATKYMLGLTGNPFREDGLSKLVRWHLGPIMNYSRPRECELVQ